MTNTNTTTQAQALRWLIDNATNAPADVIAAAEKLYTAKTKRYTSKTSKGESKATLQNKARIPEFIELFKNAPEDVKVNTSYLAAESKDPEVRSPQKARAIVELMIKEGIVNKVQEKGRTFYELA